MNTLRSSLLLGALLGFLPLLLVGVLPGCGGGGGGGGFSCPADSPQAVATVNGTYRYGQGLPGPYTLAGTISFVQSLDQITVTGCTYDNANNRDLVGLGTLVGNRLDITLVPQNGDLDYSADATFLFADAGASFCVAFSDTNNDSGPMGSFRGTLQP